MPKSTRWPGLSSPTPSGRAALCTKTSPPSSRVRKPKPFSVSYHFTRPVGTTAPSSFDPESHRLRGIYTRLATGNSAPKLNLGQPRREATEIIKYHVGTGLRQLAG